MHFLLPLCFSILFLAITCSDKQSSPQPIPEEKLVNVYCDQLLVEEECRASGADSIRKASRIDSLYKAHSVTKEIVSTTLEHYHQDLNEWKSFMVKVLIRLEALQREQESHSKQQK